MPKTISVPLSDNEYEVLEKQAHKKGANVQSIVHDIVVKTIIFPLKNNKQKNKIERDLIWDKLYGLGKGLWNEDAQEYINKLREDR